MSTLVVNLDTRVAKAPRYKRKTVADYFRKNSLKWWKAIVAQKSFKEQGKVIKEWVSGLRVKGVLELGPGTGRVTRIVKSIANEDLTLVEINERFCKSLAKEFPTASLVSADVNAYTWEGREYGLVVAMEILVHIPNIEKLMRRVQTALATNGFALVSITPLDWYLKNTNRPTTTHRGIDRTEFEEFVGTFFQIKKSHQTANGQHITYLLQKK